MPLQARSGAMRVLPRIRADDRRNNAPTRHATRPRTLQAMVNEYRRRHSPGQFYDLEFFRGLSLDKAVSHAALAENGKNKRYSHQRRIRRAPMEQAKKILLDQANHLSTLKPFDQLHAYLSKLLLPIPGLGKLYVYDTAFRLGAHLKILPSTVYLHAGTRMGARALGLTGEEIQIEDLPTALRILKAHELEDFLCIYARELLGGGPTSRACRPISPRRRC